MEVGGSEVVDVELSRNNLRILHKHSLNRRRSDRHKRCDFAANLERFVAQYRGRRRWAHNSSGDGSLSENLNYSPTHVRLKVSASIFGFYN